MLIASGTPPGTRRRACSAPKPSASICATMLSDAAVRSGCPCGKQAQVGDLGRGEQRGRCVRTRRDTGAAADAGGRVHRASSAFCFGTGWRWRRGARRSFARDEAAGRDDPVERAAVDHEVLDARGSAFARHGSTVIVVAVAEVAHVQLARRGAAARPVRDAVDHQPHEPQMPSRQSWSKAIGSSPLRSRRSFTTSSISRNDMSGLMSRRRVVDEARPALSRSAWRQTSQREIHDLHL